MKESKESIPLYFVHKFCILPIYVMKCASQQKMTRRDEMSKLYYIFAAHYFPHLGGLELYIRHMAQGLLADGNRVLVITPNPGGLPTYERMDDVPIVRLPSFPLMDGRFPIPKPNRKFFHLHTKLMARRPDRVIVNTRFYLHSLYGVFIG